MSSIHNLETNWDNYLYSFIYYDDELDRSGWELVKTLNDDGYYYYMIRCNNTKLNTGYFSRVAMSNNLLMAIDNQVNLLELLSVNDSVSLSVTVADDLFEEI